jgi:hypothetical protein
MKTFAILIGCLLLCVGCEDDQSSGRDCIQGTIVGQKCGVFALQVSEWVMGAREWLGDGAAESFSNVIGLVDLPPEYRVEGKILFVSLREPTNEESTVPCYHDLPGPPEPLYVVLHVSESSCGEMRRGAATAEAVPILRNSHF